MYLSVPIENTMEYISTTEISPLISKCYVKVCYVSQEPNRNGTVITREVAEEMGKKLPGSPVVGYYNEVTEDFEGHNRKLSICGDQMKVVDVTRPYGFVPTDAKVWFQKFDDNGVTREYLVTECYIWTGAYPESQRVLEKGNNQSMELDENIQDGFWTKDINSGIPLFIYNEALIEKLCILGEDFEPCFEGAQFVKQFSWQEFDDFRTKMFSMIENIQQTLQEGGSQSSMETNDNIVVTEQINELDNGDVFTLETAPEVTPTSTDGSDNIAEYAKLKKQYEELEREYCALKDKKSDLESEISTLREFKAEVERKNKQEMIDSFYMLTDEDKKDVIENIDTYSLNDIEAKLSIAYVRSNVDFNANNNNNDCAEDGPTGLFNLEVPVDTAPDWVKAVRETANKN